jgi:ketosteroid isomerase-like protein
MEEPVMRTLLCAFLLASSSGIAAAQFVAPDQTGDIQTLVEAGNKAWIEAYVSGDIDTLVKMHAEDSVILSPFGRRFDGVEGAREYYSQSYGFAPKDRVVTIKDSTVREYGDLIIQNSTWDFSATGVDDTPFTISGRSSVVSMRTPEGWFIIDYHPAINPPPPVQN